MPSPSAPARKFAPIPIEQSTGSSRHQGSQRDTPPMSRHFAPEHVETSTRSSNAAPVQDADPQEKPGPRRFLPQPIETSIKSSKDGHTAQEQKLAPRRFAPQVVEETHKSSKETEEQRKQIGHVKFKPEPIATTRGSNRKVKAVQELDPSKPRKFAPVLLDTSSRSRRSGDEVHAHPDKNESEYQLHARFAQMHLTRDRRSGSESEAGGLNMEAGGKQAMSPLFEQGSKRKRAISPMDGTSPRRAACLMPTRTHSYHMPDLDTIQSSESDRGSGSTSRASSPGTDASPTPVSDSSYEQYKHATRSRESVDESYTHYLRELEAKKARERLEEQALAAYPNADFGYEAPRHYGYTEDEDSEEEEIEDRPVTWEGHEDDLAEMARRESTSSMPWEATELRRHAEEAQQERNFNKITAKRPSDSPWWNPVTQVEKPAADQELKSMRDRARPPYAGLDLVYPRSKSPDQARFDVTQGSSALRKQMCYLTEAAEYERQRTGDDAGLWKGPVVNVKQESGHRSTVSSTKSTGAKGLWAGTCLNDGQAATPTGLAPPIGPTGLLTPRVESSNPLENLTITVPGGVVVAPPTPPHSVNEADLGRIDSVLVTERDLDELMEREYPNTFITQVFNYLSLGYPALARPFDEELSKISRVPMRELRQDDSTARNAPRGYIRFGPDFEAGAGEGITEDNCVRWQALKLYVREWARQEQNMVKPDAGGNWGASVRRGSWGL